MLTVGLAGKHGICQGQGKSEILTLQILRTKRRQRPYAHRPPWSRSRLYSFTHLAPQIYQLLNAISDYREI